MLILNKQTTVLNYYLHQIRDVKIQKDHKLFEHNIERIGQIAGYELSQFLSYSSQLTKTPLGEVDIKLFRDKLIIATILRAGLPMQRGLSYIYDDAELAFVGAARKSETRAGVEVDLSYTARGSLDDKVLIMTDVMLASGHSMLDAYSALLKYGKPSKVFIVCVIASQPGVDYIEANIPEAEIVAAALDPELDDNYFIVPGLGDAGDLLYGEKQ